MHDDSQLILPPSFVALFVPPGQVRPRLTLHELVKRYEICEDLAQALTEQARNLQHRLGITEDLVLAQCLQGLSGEDSVLHVCEAHWVICRLAELLDWPLPPVAPPPS